MARRLYATFFLSLVGFLALVEGATNITVDDNSDSSVPGQSVQYLPNSSDWSQGNNCSTCQLDVDPADTFDGTWHDTTFFTSGDGRGISFTFSGTINPILCFVHVFAETPRQERPSTLSSSSQTTLPMQMKAWSTIQTFSFSLTDNKWARIRTLPLERQTSCITCRVMPIRASQMDNIHLLLKRPMVRTL